MSSSSAVNLELAPNEAFDVESVKRNYFPKGSYAVDPLKDGVSHLWHYKRVASPSGRCFAMRAQDGAVYVTKAESGELLSTLDIAGRAKASHDDALDGGAFQSQLAGMWRQVLCFASDSTLHVLLGSGKTQVWDVDAGECVQEVRPPAAATRKPKDPDSEEDNSVNMVGMCLSSDGAWAACYSSRGEVVAWAVASGGDEVKRVRLADADQRLRDMTSKNTGNDQVSVRFSPDDSQLLVKGYNGNDSMDCTIGVYVVDLKRGRVVHANTLETGPEQAVKQVASAAFSEAGQGWRLVVLWQKGVVLTWDVGTGQLLGAHEQLVDTRTGPRKARPEMGTLAVSTAAGGLCAAIAKPSHDGRACVYSLDGDWVTSLPGHETFRDTPLVFSPDGSKLASSAQHKIFLWSVPSGTQLAVFEATEPVENLQFSVDGTRLLSSSKVDKNQHKLPRSQDHVRFVTRVWHLEPGEVVHAVARSTLQPDGGRYAPYLKAVGDGRHFLVSSYDTSSFSVWDSVTGEIVRTHNTDYKNVVAVFSSDATRVLVAGTTKSGYGRANYGESLQVLDGDSFEVLHSLTLPPLLSECSFTMSPDNRFVAVVAYDKVSVWDLSGEDGPVESKLKVRELRLERSVRLLVEFSTEKNREKMLVLTAARSSGDNTKHDGISVWDSSTGELHGSATMPKGSSYSTSGGPTAYSLTAGEFVVHGNLVTIVSNRKEQRRQLKLDPELCGQGACCPGVGALVTWAAKGGFAVWQVPPAYDQNSEVKLVTRVDDIVVKDIQYARPPFWSYPGNLDCARLAVVDTDGVVRLFALGGELVTVLSPGNVPTPSLVSSTSAISVAPNQVHLATLHQPVKDAPDGHGGGSCSMLKVWNLVTGELVQTVAVAGAAHAFHALDWFSPNRVIMSGGSGDAKVVQVLVGAVPSYKEVVYSLAMTMPELLNKVKQAPALFESRATRDGEDVRAGESVLHMLARIGDEATLEVLLVFGGGEHANPLQVGPEGSPLEVAVKARNDGCVRVLLTHWTRRCNTTAFWHIDSHTFVDALPALARDFPRDLTLALQAVELPDSHQGPAAALVGCKTVKNMSLSDSFRSCSRYTRSHGLWQTYFAGLDDVEQEGLFTRIKSSLGLLEPREVGVLGTDTASKTVPLRGLAGPASAYKPPKQHPIGCLVEYDLPDALGSELIRTALDFKWNRYGRSIFLSSMMWYLAFLALFTVASVQDECYSLDDGWWSYVRAVNDLVVVFGAMQYLRFEGGQMRKEGVVKYVTNGWNALDLVGMLLVLALVPFRLECWAHSSTLQSVAAVCLWLKILDFFRAFRTTGPFVRMIFRIASAIGFFLVVMVVVLFAFSHGMYLVFRGVDEVMASEQGGAFDFGSWWVLLKVYDLMLGGNFDRTELALARSEPLAIVYVLAFTLFTTVLMLNLLIALMGSVYAEVEENVENEWLMERAKIMLDLDQYLGRAELADERLFPRWIHVLDAKYKPKRVVQATNNKVSAQVERVDEIVEQMRAEMGKIGARMAEVLKLLQEMHEDEAKQDE